MEENKSDEEDQFSDVSDIKSDASGLSYVPWLKRHEIAYTQGDESPAKFGN